MEEGETEGSSSTDRYLSIGTTVKRGAFNLSVAAESFRKTYDKAANAGINIDDGLVLNAHALANQC